MKDKEIKITVRRLTDGDYTIESIDGKAEIKLRYPPACSDRQHCYRAGDTIIQEEANAIGLEYAIKTLAPK